MINFFPELKKPRSDGLASALGLEDFRNPYEIYFGLFGEDDSGGGSDNVDRSNPNEMRGREQAAARAGTVTDSQGNPVTSNVYDDSGNVVGQNVVTAGTQGQQVAAREAFNAATGNERSNYAQDQYDQVKAREDAALQRAAAAGRLAGSDRGADVSAINQALGRSDPNEIFDFDITQDRNVSMDDIGITSSSPSMALPGSLPASRSAEVSRALSNVISPILGRPQFSQASGIPQGFIDDELITRAAAGDNRALALLSPEQIAAGADARFRSQVPAVGIMTTPQATAANVLGTSPSDAGISINDPQLGNITQTTSPDGTVNRTADLGNFRSSTNITRTPSLDDASMLEDLRTTAPVPGGITTIQGPTAQDLANLDALAKAGFDDDTAEMGIRGPGSGYDARGLPTGLQTFTNNQGITATTNLAGLTQAQRDNLPGYMNPEEGGLQDSIFGNPLDTAYGYELDPQGNVTGIVGRPGGGGMVGAGMELLTNALLGPPESVEDLLNRSVYTGYGPGSQVGMDGSDDGREMSKPPTDPCPPGYFLKDGVCTPMMEDEIRTPEGGDFVFQPPTAPPTFQPITQGTPINQINPFVLQPYTPMQAQNIGASRVAQGIQPMSPTGAALGRQI